jgi:hypothetical protein
LFEGGKGAGTGIDFGAVFLRGMEIEMNIGCDGCSALVHGNCGLVSVMQGRTNERQFDQLEGAFKRVLTKVGSDV